MVNTEAASTANHSRIGHSTKRGTCRANNTQMTQSSAMCSDGAWLNGLSKLVSAANRNPSSPLVSGRAKLKRSGNRMKHTTAPICTVSSRFAWVSSSARLVQTNSDSA